MRLDFGGREGKGLGPAAAAWGDAGSPGQPWVGGWENSETGMGRGLETAPPVLGGGPAAPRCGNSRPLMPSLQDAKFSFLASQEEPQMIFDWVDVEQRGRLSLEEFSSGLSTSDLGGPPGTSPEVCQPPVRWLVHPITVPPSHA